MPPKGSKTKDSASAEKKKRQSKLAKEHGITASEENEIREAFCLFSTSSHPDLATSKEGVMLSSKVYRALTALGVKPDSKEQFAALMDAADPDRSGYVTYEHFVGIAALKLLQRTTEQATLEAASAFKLFTGGAEILTLEHLRGIAKDLKMTVDEDLLKEMILEANEGIGLEHGVTFEQFQGAMARTGMFADLKLSE